MSGNEAIERRVELAKYLGEIVKQNPDRFVQLIENKGNTTKHPRVELMKLAGLGMGLHAHIVDVDEITDPEGGFVGYQASAEVVVDGDGAVVNRGVSQCDRTEPFWRNNARYAIQGMAQTRAIARALKNEVCEVLALAGIETTPADEMPRNPSPQPEARDEPAEEAPADLPESLTAGQVGSYLRNARADRVAVAGQRSRLVAMLRRDEVRVETRLHEVLSFGVKLDTLLGRNTVEDVAAFDEIAARLCVAEDDGWTSDDLQSEIHGWW
jgi:hypothetical protein